MIEAKIVEALIDGEWVMISFNGRPVGPAIKETSEYKTKVRVHGVARMKVKRAIERGKLKRQPCEICGAVKTHGHHDDYAKPLSVRWLCPKHHLGFHAEKNSNVTLWM